MVETAMSPQGEVMAKRGWRSALAPYLARQMSESGLSKDKVPSSKGSNTGGPKGNSQHLSRRPVR